MSAALLATSTTAFFARSAAEALLESDDPPPCCPPPFDWPARFEAAEPRARRARVAAVVPVERPVLLRAADDRLLATPVAPRLAAAPRFAADPPRFAALPCFFAALPCLAAPLRFAVLPPLRLAAVPPLRLAAAPPRLAALREAAPFFATLRFAAPPVLPPRERDVDAALRAPDAEPLFFAAGRRSDDALFAPARPVDARLVLVPLDDERLRAPPVLLLERPLDRLPLLFALLLRDDFVAMCGLLRGGCAANVASSAHGPQKIFVRACLTDVRRVRRVTKARAPRPRARRGEGVAAHS
jgi:hypothetical protein